MKKKYEKMSLTERHLRIWAQMPFASTKSGHKDCGECGEGYNCGSFAYALAAGEFRDPKNRGKLVNLNLCPYLSELSKKELSDYVPTTVGAENSKIQKKKEKKPPDIEQGYKPSFGDKIEHWFATGILVVIVLVVVGCFINNCFNPVEKTWEEEQRQKFDERWGDFDDPRH